MIVAYPAIGSFAMPQDAYRELVQVLMDQSEELLQRQIVAVKLMGPRVTIEGML